MNEPKTAESTTPSTNKIITAGMDAMAHFTINPTIDPKGM
jgi:hypothetical protein